MERLYKKLESYGQSDYYPFHMPGHKRNRASSADDFLFERDITEISGFDNLHHAEGILKEAQEYAAQIYGTKKCFFSVNGSTAALLAAVSASVNKGGKILVARNCHKAVYHALYLRELQPVYIYPHEDQRLGINGGISPERVERYLEEHPEVEAVLITSPTYDGIVSNVEKIAEIAHRHEVLLIVDEAHGAHFRFSEYFPVSAADLGADIVIQSFHKTLPSMTQTAVLHVCSDRVDVEKVKQFMGNVLENPYKRIGFVSIPLAVFLFLAWNGRYCGLGTNLIAQAFSGGELYMFDWILKLFFTVLTLSIGFQGGEVTPLFSIGASLGFVLGSLAGLPPMVCAALGYAAVFGSATNTLLAPVLIGMEVFGVENGLAFFAVCLVAFLVNGNRCIYTAQKRSFW